MKKAAVVACGYAGCTPGDRRPLFGTPDYKAGAMFDNELFLGTRMSSQLWVEPVGELVLARMRGMPTEALFVECQRQVLQILRDRGAGKVLYDALEMEAPPVEVALSQRTLDETLGALKIRRAIVVPTSKLAYLARLAFGEGNYRVFYNDISAAINWLGKESSP